MSLPLQERLLVRDVWALNWFLILNKIHFFLCWKPGLDPNTSETWEDSDLDLDWTVKLKSISNTQIIQCAKSVCAHACGHNTYIDTYPHKCMHLASGLYLEIMWLLYLPPESHQRWLYFLKENSNNLKSFKIISWVAEEVTDGKKSKESVMFFFLISLFAHKLDFRPV